MVKTFAALGAAQVVRTGRSLLRSLRVKVYKAGAAEFYIQIFNTASPTLGTTAPIEVIRVPAAETILPLQDKVVNYEGPKGGQEFSTALTVACTTTHDGATVATSGQEPDVIVDYEQLGA